MYCPKCGNKTDASTSFCPNCGASLASEARPHAKVADAANSDSYEVPVRVVDEPAGAHGTMTYEQYVRFHEERDARNALAEAEDEVTFLKKRFKRCCIIGALIAVWMLAAFGCSMDTLTGIQAFLIVGSSVMVFFTPFGFLPIIDFVRRNGLFAWGWALILALFLVALMFAIVAGIPYAIHLARKIKKSEATCEGVRSNLEAVAA